MNITERLVTMRTSPLRRKIIRQVMAWFLFIDFPTTVEVGKNLTLFHRGGGLILHPATKIGDNVTIAPYSGTGALYPMDPWPVEEWPKIIIEDEAMIGVDVKILAPREGITVGRGTVIGAGSVLNKSTGEYEVWAGIPARCVRKGPPRGSKAYDQLQAKQDADATRAAQEGKQATDDVAEIPRETS